jgi:ABC-type lipoprotein release transport system permease subunit
MTTWRIAWRNLWRNKRRTVLALAAIALSVTLVLLYDGILRGYSEWMVETITGPMLGHAQVHAPEWRDTRAMDRTLPHVGRTLDAIRRQPGVTGAEARVYAPALAAVRTDGFAVFVLGLDMAAESRPGRLLAGATPPPAGQVLMGHLLATQMHVKPGDVIAIVGQGADGSMANDLFTVAGLVSTSVDFANREAILMPIDLARELFVMQDEAHEIVVYASDPEQAPAMARALGALPDLAGTEVLDWKALAPELVDILNLYASVWIFVLLLVLIAAVAGIANTMLMATYERTHELGMLLALGTAPGRVVVMIALEALVLGLLGAIAGTVIGGSLVAWGHHTGVDYAALTGGGPSEIAVLGLNWSLSFYPSLAVIDIVRVVAAVVITSLLASAWPAIRSARLEPARALWE